MLKRKTHSRPHDGRLMEQREKKQEAVPVVQVTSLDEVRSEGIS